MTRVAFLALLVVGCTFRPAPPLPPPTGPGDCATATANLRELGGCEVDLARFEADCRDTEEAEAELGIRYPTDCLTAAESCAAAEACR